MTGLSSGSGKSGRLRTAFAHSPDLPHPPLLSPRKRFVIFVNVVG